MDSNQLVPLVMLDLSAAFDTIEHNILLDTLKHWFGIQGEALTWIQSYLSERSFSVHLNNKVSSNHPLQYGVPQGSVLGPLLFTAFTTPISKIIRSKGLLYHMYADDTQVWIGLERETSSISAIETCLEDIYQWMSSNKLKINPSKTNLIVHSRNPLAHCSITLRFNGLDIPPTNSARNLGVLFDSQLTFEKHVSDVCKICFFWLKQIRSVRRYLTQDCIKYLVISLILSRLDFCNALLLNAPQFLISKLQRVQNAAARLATNSAWLTPSVPLHNQLHWLPINKRIHFKILTFVHHAIYSASAPTYLKELLSLKNPTYVTRQSSCPNLVVKIAKYRRVGQRAFSFGAPPLWNNLPPSIKILADFKEFKSTLKTYLFTL